MTERQFVQSRDPVASCIPGAAGLQYWLFRTKIKHFLKLFCCYISSDSEPVGFRVRCGVVFWGGEFIKVLKGNVVVYGVRGSDMSHLFATSAL